MQPELNLDFAKLVIKGQVINYIHIEEKKHEGKVSPAHNAIQFMQMGKSGKIELMNVKDSIGIPNIAIGSMVELTVTFSVFGRDVFYTAVELLSPTTKKDKDIDVKK